MNYEKAVKEVYPDAVCERGNKYWEYYSILRKRRLFGIALPFWKQMGWGYTENYAWYHAYLVLVKYCDK
jgi:hypothetical protein